MSHRLRIPSPWAGARRYGMGAFGDVSNVKGVTGQQAVAPLGLGQVKTLRAQVNRFSQEQRGGSGVIAPIVGDASLPITDAIDGDLIQRTAQILQIRGVSSPGADPYTLLFDDGTYLSANLPTITQIVSLYADSLGLPKARPMLFEALADDNTLLAVAAAALVALFIFSGSGR